jgi:hypothetical protein
VYFNLTLGNHGRAADDIKNLRIHLEYLQWTLFKCGYETKVSSDRIEKEAINILLEHFVDEALNSQILKLKKDHNLIIGQVATELIVNGKIPYFDNPGRVRGFELMVRELDFLWCFLERTAASYKTAARFCEFFPVGSIPGRPPAIPMAPKDLDVIFFGKKTPHRAAILDECERQGITVFSIGDGFPNGYQDDVIVKSAMQRAKLGLNLTDVNAGHASATDDPRFASCFRIKNMLDNNLCIVSEHIPFDNPYVPFMISVPLELIPRQIKDLLATGRWRDIGGAMGAAFRRDMDVTKLCRPVISRTIQALDNATQPMLLSSS